MTSGRASISARDLLESIREDARRKEVIAYTMPTFEGSAMFVNLPTVDSGPAYAWVGYWRSDDDITAQLRPSVVVATAPRREKDDVQRMVRMTHGLEYTRTREIDGVAVIVLSASVHDVDAAVQRLDDPEPLISKWFAFATHGLDA